MIIVKIGGGETINIDGIVTDLVDIQVPVLIVLGGKRA